ncbi:conserved exported hypothetical protein [Desulfamplus magnetovallimortis]|uniref:Phosphate-selective porin O and P n=1 Tax=Desulfamplus magnetovallimortis TaxID=1246637 RepID=A0A1W1HFS0_9BACT|nr:hypothetical protein [Desulfamplus magnetovallimortis]SLM31232.1 conserved exported hypothetical protein [Desulfamplus magnetovallimortis]
MKQKVKIILACTLLTGLTFIPIKYSNGKPFPIPLHAEELKGLKDSETANKPPITINLSNNLNAPDTVNEYDDVNTSETVIESYDVNASDTVNSPDTINTQRYLSGFKISGYGTLSFTVYDNGANVAPVRDITQSPDNRFKSNHTAVMDSRLGLQAHYRFNSDLDFVTQSVLRDQVEIDFENSLESAYFAYRPTYWSEFRIGRMGYDVFLMSDTRNMGYAYPWARPPLEFYGWIPVFNMDGADATFRINQGNSQWRLRLQAGEYAFPFEIEKIIYDCETEGLHNLTITRQSGNLLLKAGYSRFSFKNAMPLFTPLQEGLEQIAEGTREFFPDISDEAQSLREDIAFKDTEMTYMTLGAAYDDGQWILQAEIAKSTTTAEVLSHGQMGYAALGYRSGDWTPYLIYSAIRAGNDLRQPSADWSPIGETGLQEDAIGIINTTRMDQDTFSLGIRWDFNLKAALKLQWDSIHIHSKGYGLWYCKDRISGQDNRVNLGTLSMEFMF